MAWTGEPGRARRTRIVRRWVAGAAVAMAGWLTPMTGWGQLTLELKLSQSEFLQFERVTAVLIIKNQAKEALVVARDVADLPELDFAFHRENGRDTPRINAASMLRDVYIIPGQAEKLELDLARWYDLQRMGQCLVKATLEWKGKTYQSNQVVLEIVRGMEIPGTTQTVQGAGKALKLQIRYWRRDRVEHAFLVVDDEEGKSNYGVFDLGPLIRVQRPVVEVDESNNVKVVHQTTPNGYTVSHFKISDTGVSFVKQDFVKPDSSAAGR